MDPSNHRNTVSGLFSPNIVGVHGGLRARVQVSANTSTKDNEPFSSLEPVDGRVHFLHAEAELLPIPVLLLSELTAPEPVRIDEDTPLEAVDTKDEASE